MSSIKKVNIPDGVSGDWQVDHFTIHSNSPGLFTYGSRAPSPGEYTRLTFRGKVIMSDTPAEMADHAQFVRLAHGSVLVAGLGLGMVANAIADKPEVTHVAVIEKSADVIKLVGPHITNPKIQIVHSDIHEYKPWYNFDFAWFDIWGDLCTDDLKEMKALQKKFKKWVGHSGCWAMELLKEQKRREDKEARRLFHFKNPTFNISC